MQKQILVELKEFKSILSHLIGTSELNRKEQFSKDALDKAAKQFMKMTAQRGEWVKEVDIDKYIKGDWPAGSFIRSEFCFTPFLKDGRWYLYNKQALQKLALELKARRFCFGTFRSQH